MSEEIKIKCDYCHIVYSIKFEILEGDFDVERGAFIDPSVCEPWYPDRCLFCGLRYIKEG